MLRTPRSLAIFLALLCGVATSHSQAPSDRVFLTERFPVKTHSGLIGFPPGTALHAISKNGDTFRVSDGTQTFDVPKNKLTTDPNLAARLEQNEYAAQEEAAQLSAQQMEAYRQAQVAKRAQQEQQAAAQRQAQQQAEAEMQRQEEGAARQQQLRLERAQAAKRIAANNGKNRSQIAAQQRALQQQKALQQQQQALQRQRALQQNPELQQKRAETAVDARRARIDEKRITGEDYRAKDRHDNISPAP